MEVREGRGRLDIQEGVGEESRRGEERLGEGEAGRNVGDRGLYSPRGGFLLRGEAEGEEGRDKVLPCFLPPIRRALERGGEEGLGE